jgi:mono/diheme cytochrome c family protein
MSDSSSSLPHPTDPLAGPGGVAGGADSMGDQTLQSLHAKLLHEKEEPSEGFSLIPIFLIFLGCVLVYMNGIYLATRSGGFHGDVYNDHWVPGNNGPAVIDPYKLGARVFKDNCATCHQPDGKGKEGQYPPLAGSPWPVGDPARAIKIVLAGMGGPITVNGNTVPNGSMPAVGATLPDAQIAAVLTYVRGTWGNNDTEVDSAIVTQTRAEIGRRGAWTPDEILKENPLGAAPAAAPAASGTSAGPGASAPAAASATN